MPQLLGSLLPPPKYGPTEVLGRYAWAAVIAFLVSLAMTPVVRALARRWKVVDKPDGFLKPHVRPIAYLGGIAVYLGYLAGLLFAWTRLPEARPWWLGLSLAGGVVLLVGLADDILDVKPAVKLLGQVAAAAVLLSCGIGRDIALVLVVPIRLLWPAVDCPHWLVTALSAPMTVFLVIAACNATNLLDGLDGLCSGVTGIISLMFLVLAVHLAMYGYSEPRDPVRIAAALAMFGAVLGFLPFNRSPATIFLGDAGSMLLGLFAAAMILMFGERGIFRWVLGALMIFGLPILDTFLALLRRLRLKRPVFGGDRSHLYDQLVDRGFSVRQAVAISYGLSVFYGVMGLGIILIPVGYGRYSLLIYAAVAAVTLWLCHCWGFLRPPVGVPGEQAAGSADGEGGDDADER